MTRGACSAMVVALLAAIVAPAAAEQPNTHDDATPPDARQVLARAFANRYEVDVASRIDLVMSSRDGQQRRRSFEAISAVIDDRVHSLGRLVWPNHLRGMTILTIEATDRSHDAFVYLPSLGKMRRITTAQRGESFLGSDVTYEDLERRRVEEYDLESLEDAELAGEPVWTIRTRSLREFSYDVARFWIAQSDDALLRVEYFKSGQEEPFRVLDAPRAFVVQRDGHALPTRMIVHDRRRGTTTEVAFHDLVVNPPIDPHIFSATTLEAERDLPL